MTVIGQKSVFSRTGRERIMIRKRFLGASAMSSFLTWVMLTQVLALCGNLHIYVLCTHYISQFKEITVLKMTNKVSLNIFFFRFGYLRHTQFPGQGSDLSGIVTYCDARSLTHCAVLESEPVTQCSRDAADPIVPQ